jgi:hypothetical protein
MMSRPRFNSSSVITSGGATCMRLKCMNGHSPPALQAAATGGHGSGIRTRSH